jgi:signal transduction histidine kinase
MSRTIDEFRRFFDPGTTREHFLLQTALTDLQNLLQPELNEKHIRFEIRQQEEELRINGYQNRFKQALLNLVSNARDAIGTARCEGILPRTVEGKISLDVSVEAGWIVLELTDNGGGIDAGLMDKIFDPYFSTKGQGEGVGLGLYMSRVIIEKYFGGSVTVKNIQGGLSVTVRLSPDAA